MVGCVPRTCCIRQEMGKRYVSQGQKRATIIADLRPSAVTTNPAIVAFLIRCEESETYVSMMEYRLTGNSDD